MKILSMIAHKLQHCLISAIALSALVVSQANAMSLVPTPVPGDEVAASLAAYAICRIFDDHNTCVGVMMAVDPVPSNSIKEIGISLTYDTTKYSFRPDLSGPACEFGVGGLCLSPVTTAYNTPTPIELIHPEDYSPAALLPGSSIDFNVSLVSNSNLGLIDALLSYKDPLTIGGEATNFMYLYFDLVTPFDSFPLTTITPLTASISTPGTSAMCTSTQPSGSVSVGDSDFTQESYTCTIPEPGTLAIIALGWVTMVSVGSRRHILNNRVLA